jgi:hypothetical protein
MEKKRGGLRVLPPAGQRVRTSRATIALPAELRARLEARGARGDKSHGPYNYTRQLSRTLVFFDAVVERSDPRRTRELPQPVYDLVVEVLTDPLSIETFGIAHLGAYLRELPAFREGARELALEPAALSAQLDAYPFAEKLHLVLAAQVRHVTRP